MDWRRTACPSALRSLSPTLITMLQDTFLQDRYLAHLGKMEALGDKEILRNQGDPRFDSPHVSAAAL